ncbi:hypothetical protein JGU66_16605 [Myxococcaceae bacterium JPH2]|nr:hypothetical protein [Myxococcaceae bacterium JPH2]
MPTKKKRPRRKPAKPPPRRPRSAPKRRGRAPVVSIPRELQYKVVELSTVEEGTLERTLNEWTAKGWNLDGVQFAMREASKRPAMAFVFFTREGAAATHDEDAARARLMRLSETGGPTALLATDPLATHRLANEPSGESEDVAMPRIHPLSARERLARLAGLDEPDPVEEGLMLEPEE